MATTEFVSLKIEDIPTESVLDNPRNSPSLQICFEISYQIKRNSPSIPITPANETVEAHFHSNINNNPSAARVAISRILGSLGINSRYHAGLIVLIMRDRDRIFKSVSGRKVLALRLKIYHCKNYFSLKSVKEDEEEGRKICSVCLEEIDENGASTPCAHVFHANCITKWLDKTENCPLCRFDMHSDRYIEVPIEGSKGRLVPVFGRNCFRRL